MKQIAEIKSTSSNKQAWYFGSENFFSHFSKIDLDKIKINQSTLMIEKENQSNSVVNAWLEKGTPAHSYHKKKNPYYLIQEKPVSVQEFFLHQNPGVTAFFLIRFRQIQNTLLNIFWLQNHVLIVLNWKVYDLDQKYSQIFSFLAFSDENDQKWPPKYHNSSIMTYSKGNLT